MNCIELFAGAGGLALGLEKAGFKHQFLNDIDKNSCETIRLNRPDWPIECGDIHKISFKKYSNKVDLLSGGFPCQPFSSAGRGEGFKDTRGALFFEFLRAVKEVKPRAFLFENVKSILKHNKGRSFIFMRQMLEQAGYVLQEPMVLNAWDYGVPQKRERLFLVGIRKDLNLSFNRPEPYPKKWVLKDAFFAGNLYPIDVPKSDGFFYPESKKQVLDLVPPGGCWRDLPTEVAKEYLGNTYFSEGGKTGFARRLSLNEPSLTLTCSPVQKQTERCHPLETRPFTLRESARIQTFPDDWKFFGSTSSVYAQVGNAVPVNLAYEIGKELFRMLAC